VFVFHTASNSVPDHQQTGTMPYDHILLKSILLSLSTQCSAHHNHMLQTQQHIIIICDS